MTPIPRTTTARTPKRNPQKADRVLRRVRVGGCDCYRGSTYSTFKNSSFCWPLPTVWTCYYHHYVRAYGWPSGSISGTRSTDTVDECLPLWMHYQVKNVT